MIQELATMVAMFRTTNDQFIQLTASMGAPLGLTSRSIEAAMDEMTKPLPLLPP
jgi:hypothetical protein